MIKQNSIWVILFISILTSSFGQELKNQLDADGKRHGVWSKNYDNTDQLRYEGQFEHGKETGLFKFYKIVEGKSVLTATKIFDVKTGIADVVFLASTGKKISEGKMKGKDYIGKWVYYHKDNDKVMTSEFYNDQGELEGERKVFYPDGNIAEIALYANGKLNGVSKVYAENGTQIKEFTYKDGELHGPSVYYNDQKQLLAKGNYRHDQKTGTWQYYEDGKLKEEKDYTVYSKNPKKQ